MMSSATEKKYRLTNEWIIGELEITEEEQQNIGLSRASEMRSERMSRNYTRDLIRNLLREDRDNKILSLFSAGMSKSAIARELSLSWNTVAKVIAMEEERAMAQEPEMAAEEPMAAGAEYQSVTVENRKPNSSKSVRNNIVSYGEGVSLVSSARGQAIKSRVSPLRNSLCWGVFGIPVLWNVVELSAFWGYSIANSLDSFPFVGTQVYSRDVEVIIIQHIRKIFVKNNILKKQLFLLLAQFLE